MDTTECEVEHLSKITVFPKETKQDEFFDENGRTRNGSCVILPTVCTCSKELNGCFELYIELVNPSDNVMKHISCWNYVVAPIRGRWDDSGKVTRKNQIFYITSMEKSCNENGTVNYKIYANHVFYMLFSGHLNSYIWNNGIGKTEQNCRDLLVSCSNISNMKYTVGTVGLSPQIFTLSSDVTGVGAIMDSNGILQKFKVELHRDNFYFSARKIKEFSKGDVDKPAFRFLHGKEITGITESVDYTNTVTKLEVFDENDLWRTNIFIPPLKLGIPYEVRRIFRASSEKELWEQREEASEYFDEVNHPELSCTITLSAINQSLDYSELSGLGDCDIGDVGIIYSSSLKSNVLQKVSRTVEDVLLGQYTEIILGNIPGSIAQVYNSTKVIGLQKYETVSKNGGGFTADVTVSDGKNIVEIAASALFDSNNDFLCEALVDFGDTYNVMMSSQPQHITRHSYAYNGMYKLTYNDCFDETGKVMGLAMRGTGAFDGAADVDNIIFFDGTKKIGQYKVETGFPGNEEQLGVFKNCQSITKITIPKGVEYISSKCFPYCLNLKEIYFGGTVNEWQEMSKLSLKLDSKNNRTLTGWIDMYNVMVHCTDGDTIQPGEHGVNPKYGV